MQHRTAYLSFWDVEMSNFPTGAFRRRALSKDEARSVINSARAAGRLVCVAKADLGAPACEREREHHKQLCAALRHQADVEVQLQDFFSLDSANPLYAAQVGEQKDLLVVDCAFAVDTEARADAGPAGFSGSTESFEARKRRLSKDAVRMNIAPDSIKFYVFEQIEGGALPSDESNS